MYGSTIVCVPVLDPPDSAFCAAYAYERTRLLELARWAMRGPVRPAVPPGLAPPPPEKPPARMSDLYSLLYELLQELDMALPEHKIEALEAEIQGMLGRVLA